MNWKEWVRTFVLVWGAAAILGGSNGYLSHHPEPTKVIERISAYQLSPAQEVARTQFFFLADSLDNLKKLSTLQGLDHQEVVELKSISKQLADLPRDLPWDPTMKLQLEAMKNDWNMTDAIPIKEEEKNKEIRVALESTVSKLVEILHSLCNE